MKALRWLGRVASIGVGLAVAGLVAVQFESIVARNVALARQVAASRADVEALRLRRERDLRDVGRLSTARGAVPEIHDRLHLVGRGEELIFVQGDRPTPQPDVEGER